MGKVIFNNDEYAKAAITYEKEFLKIPMLTIGDYTKYMTMRTGVTGTVLVGQESVSAEFAPYKANRASDANLDIVLRPLTAYFASLNADFEPNEAISTIVGHRASQAMGSELSNTVTARDVLALIAKRASNKLATAIWKGKRKVNGTTSVDIFDGFDTIVENEITTGAIAAAKGNFYQITETITSANADKVLKKVMFAMDPQLRAQECFMFVSQDIYDAYCEAYLDNHKGVMYNDKYEQIYLEGSNKKITIVPVADKAGSKFIQVTPKDNLLVGVDQESDAESVNVKDYKPDTLTFMMRMFIGVQIKSLDKAMLLVAKLQTT